MRLVGYVRVSLGEEDPSNQRYQLTEYCARQGIQLVDVVEDVGVGGDSPPLERPGFSKAVRLLEGGAAEGVIVVALDRVARSLVEFFNVYKTFSERGWQLLSVREEWLANLDPKIKPLILALLSWAAEMERDFIRERTRAALARARAEGRRLGRRPKWSEEMRTRIIDLVGRGLTLREACKLAGIGYTTASRRLSRDPAYLDAVKQARLSGRRRG